MSAATLADLAPRQTLAELLSDGLFVDGDWVESKDQDPNGEVRLIQLADIGDGVFRDRSARFLTVAKAREMHCTFLEPGDLLIARMPEPLGRACIFPGVGQPAITAVDVCILRPNPQRARPEWLVRAINSPDFRAAMQSLVRGTTRQRISRTNLGTLSLSVPRVDGQLRLARFLDELESRRNRASTRVMAASQALGRFRRAILVAACSGRLTASWREGRDLPIPEVEAKANRRRNVRPLGEFPLGEIPAEWRWVQADDILPEGGIFDGPFGSNLKTADYTEAGSRVIRLENVGHLEFIGTKKTFVSHEKYQALIRHAVYPGDIIFSSFVDENVRICVLPTDVEGEALAKADCFTLRPTGAVVPFYLAMQLAAPRSYGFLAGDVHGATRPRVNTTQVRSLPLPLCSREEQEQIVLRAERLFRLADVMQKRIDGVTKRVDRSSQAILAKAFRGGLQMVG